MIHRYLITWFAGKKLDSLSVNRDITPLTYKLDSVDNVIQFEKGFSLMKPGEQIDICVSIDMSGSISQEQARDFISEVVGITNQFEQYRLHIWTFDTAVYNPEIFSSDDGKSVADYEINGGGGTMFECNWEFMKEQGIEPKKFIMFTDGYPCGAWCSKGDEDYCDTIFVVHGSKTIVAPFGQTCYYDEEK